MLAVHNAVAVESLAALLLVGFDLLDGDAVVTDLLGCDVGRVTAAASGVASSGSSAPADGSTFRDALKTIFALGCIMVSPGGTKGLLLC
uniref:Secreted protein n=1 Tax=Plectus sambesii TaxID=2011161 RepID=A0A914XAL4_9BILA